MISRLESSSCRDSRRDRERRRLLTRHRRPRMQRRAFKSVTFPSRTSVVATAVEIPTRAPPRSSSSGAADPRAARPAHQGGAHCGAEAYAGKLLTGREFTEARRVAPVAEEELRAVAARGATVLAVVNTTSVSHVPLARAATRRNVRTLAVLRTEPEPAPEDDPQTARRRAIAVEMLQAGFATLLQSWTRRLKQRPRELLGAMAELSEARDWSIEFISNSRIAVSRGERT